MKRFIDYFTACLFALGIVFFVIGLATLLVVCPIGIVIFGSSSIFHNDVPLLAVAAVCGGVMLSVAMYVIDHIRYYG